MSANRLGLWISTIVMLLVLAWAILTNPSSWYIYIALALWSIGVGVAWRREMDNELKELDKLRKGKS